MLGVALGLVGCGSRSGMELGDRSTESDPPQGRDAGPDNVFSDNGAPPDDAPPPDYSRCRALKSVGQPTPIVTLGGENALVPSLAVVDRGSLTSPATVALQVNGDGASALWGEDIYAG